MNNRLYLFKTVNEEIIQEIINKIYDAIAQTPQPKEINLFINSIGGNAWDALALINVMDECPIRINTICLHVAMSASAAIFISGHKRYIAKNAIVMFHQLCVENGNVSLDEHMAQLKCWKMTHQNFINLIKNKSRNGKFLTDKYIKNKMLTPTDNYFTAAQMIELGLADAYYENKA